MNEAPEFGHVFWGGKGLRVDTWGVGPFVISVKGKSYRFEDSDRFGPALIKANGEIRSEPYPPEKSPFWRAHRIWVRQGRRVEDRINCIWDEPKPTTIRMLGRRVAVVVENGEEDGETIVIKTAEGKR